MAHPLTLLNPKNYERFHADERSRELVLKTIDFFEKKRKHNFTRAMKKSGCLLTAVQSLSQKKDAVKDEPCNFGAFLIDNTAFSSGPS